VSGRPWRFTWTNRRSARATPWLNGSIISGDFDTWDLQRVEVLRGPQGTLYGANSEGGLLKFVTTARFLGSFSGAAEVTGEA